MKFFVLLKKEIKELLTPQMLVPFVIMVLFFVFIGNLIGGESKKNIAAQAIMLVDQDKTPLSRSVSDILTKNNYKVTKLEGVNVDEAINRARNESIPIVINIPQGFQKDVLELKGTKIEAYNILKNFSILASMASQTTKIVTDAINYDLSNGLLKARNLASNPESIKTPVKIDDFVIIGQRSANISLGQVTGFINSQTTFIPIIMFLVIVVAAQMIAVTIASEKENKTLETLLSTPISRVSLVMAKMIAAGTVSLIMAIGYIFGFGFYMRSVTAGVGGDVKIQASEGIRQLGLYLDITGYGLLGASLFLSILIALSISIILGAFADDVKKVQGLIAPLTFVIMIPYFLTMFVDLNSASAGLKLLVYLIPFSHTFLASPNLFLHNYGLIAAGLLYQIAVFLFFVLIAIRIFKSDKIITMKLNMKRFSFRR